jgi:sigma-B regulation protein RsbQ
MYKNIVKRNNVRVFGEGTQPLLFAHGFGCDQHVWKDVYPAFERDYNIVLFDYVGSSNSDNGAFDCARYNKLEGYADDMLEVIHELGLHSVIMAGHSISSMIGLLAAIRQPELFEQLIFVTPSPCYINDEGYVGGFERSDIESLMDRMDANYLEWAKFMGPVTMNTPDRPELAEALTQQFSSRNHETIKHFARTTFFADYRKELSKLRVPSLILQSEEDFVVPMEVGEYLHRTMPGSTLRVIDAKGHYPHISAPAVIISEMKRYLGRRAFVGF